MKVFSLALWSGRIHAGLSRALRYLRVAPKRIYFRLQDYHLLRWPFPEPLTNIFFCNFARILQDSNARSCNHLINNDCSLGTNQILGCSLFARHYLGNLLRFLFLKVLRCFSSLGPLYPIYFFNGKFLVLNKKGFPIRTSPGHRLLPPHRGLSQVCHVLLRLSLPRHSP